MAQALLPVLFSHSWTAGALACDLQNLYQTLERETGIEPATNSLEGCDSTTELLPPLLTSYSLLFPL